MPVTEGADGSDCNSLNPFPGFARVFLLLLLLLFFFYLLDMERRNRFTLCAYPF